MLTTVRSAIPLLIVALVAIVGAIALLLTNHAVPAELWGLAFGALTGGGVATVPHSGGATIDTAGGPVPVTAVIPPPPGSAVNG